MLDLLLGFPVEKSEGKLFIGNKGYHRHSITGGISFADGCLVLVGVFYYPESPHILHHDSIRYPIDKTIEELRGRHGNRWEDFYRQPKRNQYDIMGEHFFLSLTDLQDLMDRLMRFETGFYCGNWEMQDFGYLLGNVMPVGGDKIYFNTLAEQIRQDERTETSDACKRILSRDEGMLLALGIAVASLEKTIFGEVESVQDDSSFVSSYT